MSLLAAKTFRKRRLLVSRAPQGGLRGKLCFFINLLSSIGANLKISRLDLIGIAPCLMNKFGRSDSGRPRLHLRLALLHIACISPASRPRSFHL